MNVEEKVVKIISEIFKVDKSKITKETEFVKDLKAKSYDVLELIAALEEEFDIEIDVRDALKNKTVGEAIEYIRRLVKNK